MKAPLNVRSLARTHTEKAIDTLVAIMDRESATDAAKVSAAAALLDRGWGKPTQPIAGDDDMAALSIVGKIERVIVPHTPDRDGADI